MSVQSYWSPFNILEAFFFPLEFHVQMDKTVTSGESLDIGHKLIKVPIFLGSRAP